MEQYTFPSITSLSNAQQDQILLVQNLLDDNNLVLLPLQNNNCNNMLAALSQTIYSKTDHAEQIQNQCQEYLQKIVKSEQLPYKLMKFKQIPNLVQDYLNTPSLKGFENITLELISMIYQVKVIIYHVSEDNYLNSLIINNKFEKAIQLFKSGNNHFDIVLTKQQQEVMLMNRDILQDILQKELKITLPEIPFNQIQLPEDTHVPHKQSQSNIPRGFGRHKKSLSESNLLHLLDSQQGSYNLFSQNPPQDIFKMFIRERQDSGINFQNSIINQILTPIQGPVQPNTQKQKASQVITEKKSDQGSQTNLEKLNSNQEKNPSEKINSQQRELEQTEELPELHIPEQALANSKKQPPHSQKRELSVNSDDSKDYFENNPRLKDPFNNFSYQNFENPQTKPQTQAPTNEVNLLQNQFKKLILDPKSEELKSLNPNLGSLKDLSMQNFNNLNSVHNNNNTNNFNNNTNTNTNNNINFTNENNKNSNSNINQFNFSQNPENLGNFQVNHKKSFLNQPQFASVNNLNNKQNDFSPMYPIQNQFNPNSMMNLEAFSMENQNGNLSQSNKQNNNQKNFISFLDHHNPQNLQQKQAPNKNLSEANESPYMENMLPQTNFLNQQHQSQQQLNINLQKNNSYSYTNPQSPYNIQQPQQNQNGESSSVSQQFKFSQGQVGNSQFATMQPQFGNSPMNQNLMGFPSNQFSSQQDLDAMSTNSAQQQIQMPNSNVRFIGRLKFFDEVKNYGFLIMDDGSDIFVHYDDLQKANIPKEVLKSGKNGCIIKFSFKCLNYIGRHNRSRKAVELSYIPNEGELGPLQLQQSQSAQLPGNSSFLSPGVNTNSGNAFNFQPPNFSQFGQQQQLQQQNSHQQQSSTSQSSKQEQNRTQSPFMGQQQNSFANGTSQQQPQQQQHLQQQQQSMQGLTQEQMNNFLQQQMLFNQNQKIF